MEALHASGWEGWIKQTWCHVNRPLLGICLACSYHSEGVEGAPDGDVVAGLDLILAVWSTSVTSDWSFPMWVGILCTGTSSALGGIF